MDNIVNDLEKGGENPLSAKRLSFNDIVSIEDIKGMPLQSLMAFFETLDTDKDGKIDIDEARKIINTLNAEDIEITPEQLGLVVAMFSKQSS